VDVAFLDTLILERLHAAFPGMPIVAETRPARDGPVRRRAGKNVAV
jgi:hypothetical protein